MTGERVLITGGAGLIGSHIADEAVRLGASEVVVLDNHSRGRRENLHLPTTHVLIGCPLCLVIPPAATPTTGGQQQ